MLRSGYCPPSPGVVVVDTNAASIFQNKQQQGSTTTASQQVVLPLSTTVSSFESITAGPPPPHREDETAAAAPDDEEDSLLGTTTVMIERTPLIKNNHRKYPNKNKNNNNDSGSMLIGVRSSLDEFDFASPEEVPFVPPLEQDPFQLMETGNLSWCRPHHTPPAAAVPGSSQQQQQTHPHNMRDAVLAAQPSTGSTASLPSNDPRKSIHHKRHDLTTATDASSSLGTIDFSELQLTEVIGGGGFGQVWRATWRGTPIAVKVLTGAAQSQRVPRSVLEEFAAELNVLSGCRHPNVCLYMGACLEPPHRAIVTELAVHGSVWDALRLPLAAPYTSSSTTTPVVWPAALWKPDAKHGSPPRSALQHHAAAASSSSTSLLVLPPRLPGHVWPWPLVLRVARGAARGMAYLHSGRPPVVHRDLKSANLLLDESYTPKVCDFGLSRLQSSSMTGNCGTVQWMART